MANTLTASNITSRALTLKSHWQRRNTKFLDWYRTLQLKDELEQENMESFVSSDPRSAYNLLLHMLNSPRIPHRIPPELVTPELVIPAGNLSKLLDVAWQDVFTRYRLSGRASWMRDLIGFMLATGWYSVIAMTSQDGTHCIAEVLNPGTVFPVWDDELVECARIDSISAGAAARLIARNQWKVAVPKISVLIYDYWYIEANQVMNAVVLGDALAKPSTPETRFSRIPIFTAPVGGLPDTGILSQDPEAWKEDIGQASLATAESVYRSMNKWWTFSMQLLRDTAQSRWFERSAGGKPILKKEDLYKRGFIARLGPNDEVGPLPVPPIPVELRSMQLDMEAMLQRAGPPWSMFGTSTQGMTAYAMAQIASGAAQMAQPYHQGVIDVLTDIDNFWLEQIRASGSKPYGMGFPKELPETTRVTASYDIRIPGDIIQRATVARMLDPDFRLSSTRVTEELFPEVKNPMEEKAQVMADKAETHPIRAYISLILSLRQEAATIRKTPGGNTEAARLYELAANNIEQSLGVSTQEQPTQQASARPEVVPNREQTLNNRNGEAPTPVS